MFAEQYVQYILQAGLQGYINLDYIETNPIYNSILNDYYIRILL